MDKDSLIIIGLDPGTVVTGYGLIAYNAGQYHVLDFGCIKPPPKWKLSDRYGVIFDGVGELLDKYHPEHLVVETQYVGENPRSTMTLSMARGIIIIRANKHKPKQIPIFEYAPNSAKRAVTGTGKASKYQVQGMVKQLLKLTTEPPQDAADALALCICHAHHIRFKKMIAKEL